MPGPGAGHGPRERGTRGGAAGAATAVRVTRRGRGVDIMHATATVSGMRVVGLVCRTPLRFDLQCVPTPRCQRSRADSGDEECWRVTPMPPPAPAHPAAAWPFLDLASRLVLCWVVLWGHLSHESRSR